MLLRGSEHDPVQRASDIFVRPHVMSASADAAAEDLIERGPLRGNVLGSSC